MQLPSKLRAILSVSLLITILSGCGDDDKITNPEAIELYAQLSITRVRQPGGVLIVLDTISASFDSVYSPASPSKPCRSVDILCNSYALQWEDEVQRHIYTDESIEGIDGYLELGGIYIFKADSGQAIPAFEKSITFPTGEPWIQYPRARLMPEGLDSVSIASGFTITWTGTSSDAIELIITDDVGETLYPADTLFHIITDNDGAIDLAPGDLVNLVPENVYRIIATVGNSEAVISEGYDPRSRIVAENRTFSTFFAM